MRFKLSLLFILSALFAGILFVFFDNDGADTPAEQPQITQNQTQPPTDTQTPPPKQLDKNKFSKTDPSSIWILVNKRNSIPTDYVPELIVPDVRLRLNASHQQMKFSAQAKADLEEMFAAAKNDGVDLVFGSGYRSASLQKQFYDSYVASDGQELADTYSARPGHSEHQTGLAVDITSPSGTCHLEICWEDTPEGQWVKDNAHTYGFIIRYPKGKDSITGYQYEPWHLRYVGSELSKEIHKTGLTYEEFFDLPRAPDYL